VVFFEHIWVTILFQNSAYKSLIFVISNTTTIVDFSTNIIDNFPWSVGIFILEYLKLSFTADMIFKSKFIQNIPSYWSEFFSFIDNRVEETQTEL